jgi:HAD superfamily hydrolase (TIGR01509 family)
VPPEPAAAAGPAALTTAAVIFDVDGTLADSERDGHRVAFNEAFAAAGLPFQWDADEYGRLLRITGGRRRIAAFLESRGYHTAEAGRLAGKLHADKTERFRELISRGRVPARPGARRYVATLRAAGMRLAVATTGTRAWVEPLLDTLFGPGTFEVVVTGSEVTALKPDPAVYREALALLGVAAGSAMAVEDSENGLRAALAAGLACVVVTNDYTRGQDFTGARAVLPGFPVRAGDPALPLPRALPQRPVMRADRVGARGVGQPEGP